MTSEEGLNAYGAATQFFIYQGFNDRVGWMHTSSGVDVVDEFLETIVRRRALYYRYGDEERPVVARPSPFPTDRRRRPRRAAVRGLPHPSRADRARRSRTLGQRRADAPAGRGAEPELFAHQGARPPASCRPWSFRPIRRTTPSMPMPTATSPTCTRNSSRARRPLRLYAAGRRQRSRQPTGGAARSRRGAAPAQSAQRLDPEHQQLALLGRRSAQSAARGFSRYMDTAGENPRGIHALRLLTGMGDFTLARLQAAAYDPWLPAFELSIPPLLRAFDQLPEHGSAQAAAGRADRGAAGLGPALGRDRSRPRSPSSGARRCSSASARAVGAPA